MNARRISILAIAILLLGMALTSPVRAEDPLVLWPAPETNSLGISFLGGYSLGNEFEGGLVGARILFYFKYFFASVTGDMVFADEGFGWSMKIDLNGRYGPFYVGVTPGMHWLPGTNGYPSPGVGLQAGLQAPLGLDGFWIDVSYRPNLIFLKARQLSYHSFYLALIIETGL